MARRHGTKSSSSKSRSSRPFNRKDSRVKRWETRDDIPEDQIDRFHNSKDRILLEGDDGSDDGSDDEEEVFALKGMPEDSEEDSDEGDDEEESDDGGQIIDDHIAPVSGSSKAKKSATKKGNVSPPSSEASESESDEEGWGKNKSEYYASNAGELDSEDEEANELEEQEAKRLQAKARETLTEDDFGLADVVDIVTADMDDILDEAATLALPALPQDKPSLLRHMEKTNPEALALARDWEEVAYTLMETQAKIETLESNHLDALSLGMAHLHYQALQTYATTLAFYLHLRATEKYAARPDLLRAHPIMARLLTLKQSLATLEDLGFNSSDDDDEMDDEEDDALGLWQLDQLKGLDQEELTELMKEAAEIVGAQDLDAGSQLNGSATDGSAHDGHKERKKKKTKKSNIGETDNVFSTAEPPKKKRKTASAAPLPIFDLVEPTFPANLSHSSSSRHATLSDAGDPYGELTTLSTADAQDKASRKRSLRFHTSKIETASARRDRARTGAYGGDDDIPWKDRRKEKKVPEAKRGMGGDDLDGMPPDEGGDVVEESGKRRRESEEGADEAANESGESDADGYYELVKRKSKEKKEKKKIEYEALVAAERFVPDADTATGPRSLTHAILSNKGLTPHRSKSVRNPRVKKRQKFEKAKKRVSSQKAVFKGGVAASAGRYDGEKTGISRVVKSVKL